MSNYIVETHNNNKGSNFFNSLKYLVVLLFIIGMSVFSFYNFPKSAKVTQVTENQQQNTAPQSQPQTVDQNFQQCAQKYIYYCVVWAKNGYDPNSKPSSGWANFQQPLDCSPYNLKDDSQSCSGTSP